MAASLHPSLFVRSGVMNQLRLHSRKLSVSSLRCKHVPLTSDELPRAAGLASMFRLPVKEESQGLDACFVGVPFDSGTSYRPGSRLGPRQIRSESVSVSNYNIGTGAVPYESLNVADCGDVRLNMYNIPKAIEAIKKHFTRLMVNDCRTIAIGGDHTVTYPILQAVKDKYGPVGLIHVDAHDDTASDMFGEPVTHGTPFYLAGEEGCLDFTRSVQIGLRGTGYGPNDYAYASQCGIRVVPVEQCWHKSLTPLMREIKTTVGDKPVYLSVDIDAIDPAYAPGTGFPEIGGLTVIQVLEIIRGCRGLNIVGCDLVEVSPPLDPSGRTALLAANLLFEMLCVLPGVKYTPVIL